MIDADEPVATARGALLIGRLLTPAAALVAVVLSGLRAYTFWRSQAYVDATSGAWMTMAQDLAHGVLYRPLIGPEGIGGARYFPLSFSLHALAIRMTGDTVWSGFAVAACAMALLMGGVYALARRIGATKTLACACAAFVLVARPAQEGLLAVKGDVLAAALNVWGLAVCAGAIGGAGLLASALLFALSFATKVTSVSGVGAALVWLMATGRVRQAGALLGCTAAGMSLVLATMYLGSHGLVFDIFRASATAGGGLGQLLQAPFTLARQARRVPETLVFIQLGFAAALVFLVRPRPLQNPALLFFVAVFAVTTVIFGSPGTDTNHFIDLHVASILLVASWISAQRAPWSDFGGAALLVAALAASLSLVSGLANAKGEQRRGAVADALRLIPDRSKPILAENPLVPIVAGQRPYLLDAYMLRVLVERDPAFGDPLWADLRRHRFAAVVFENDPAIGRARSLYREILGQRFVEAVEQSYEPAGQVGTRTVYLPRPEQP